MAGLWIGIMKRHSVSKVDELRLVFCLQFVFCVKGEYIRLNNIKTWIYMRIFQSVSPLTPVASFVCSQSFSLCASFPKYWFIPMSSPFWFDLEKPSLDVSKACHMYSAHSSAVVPNGYVNTLIRGAARERRVDDEDEAIEVRTKPG